MWAGAVARSVAAVKRVVHIPGRESVERELVAYRDQLRLWRDRKGEAIGVGRRGEKRFLTAHDIRPNIEWKDGGRRQGLWEITGNDLAVGERRGICRGRHQVQGEGYG